MQCHELWFVDGEDRLDPGSGENGSFNGDNEEYRVQAAQVSIKARNSNTGSNWNRTSQRGQRHAKDPTGSRRHRWD